MTDQGAYKTITEASKELEVPQHVLRFWETKFKQIAPQKINGRRYYTASDLELITQIKHLLYEKGYTIAGVITYLNNEGQSAGLDSGMLGDLRKKLLAIKDRLKRALEE